MVDEHFIPGTSRITEIESLHRYYAAAELCKQCSVLDAASGDGHMWNAVRLEGEIYYLDPTWNDSEEDVRHTYFNVTSAELAESHRVHDETVGKVVAEGVEYNYFRMTDAYFETCDQKKIAARVARGLVRGEKEVQLRFSATAVEEALFFMRSSSWFMETVNAQSEKGDALLEAYHLFYEENYNTVTICKKTLDSTAGHVV